MTAAPANTQTPWRTRFCAARSATLALWSTVIDETSIGAPAAAGWSTITIALVDCPVSEPSASQAPAPIIRTTRPALKRLRRVVKAIFMPNPGFRQTPVAVALICRNVRVAHCQIRQLRRRKIACARAAMASIASEMANHNQTPDELIIAIPGRDIGLGITIPA
jgi:hypothetical protein